MRLCFTLDWFCNEAVLRYNLFDSRVEGLRREVSGEGERQVAAWRQIMLLPFYTLGDEQQQHHHSNSAQQQQAGSKRHACCSQAEVHSHTIVVLHSLSYTHGVRVATKLQ
jgi:hypothetical protein